jgi:hypothetical protein
MHVSEVVIMSNSYILNCGKQKKVNTSRKETNTVHALLGILAAGGWIQLQSAKLYVIAIR